jgi:hypothetical protein
MSAIAAFFVELVTIGVKWGLATAEERKKLEEEAEASWQRHKAKIFALPETIEQNNATVAKEVDEKFGPETKSAPALLKPMTGLLSDDGSDAS